MDATCGFGYGKIMRHDSPARLHTTYYDVRSKCFWEDDAMARLTVRNLPDKVHRALGVRAAQHGHSTAAEVRAILTLAVMPENRVKMGDALAEVGRKVGLTSKAVESMEDARDKLPANPLRLE
jgi:plasmid stability protein